MQKYITIGVAGHVDHGKTSLVRLLNKRKPEKFELKKKRSLSDKAVIVPWYYSDNPAITFIDVPGHMNFFINTVRGLSAADMAILVVAADDGVMPQTIEHLNVLNFFKVKKGFIILTKTDLVDDEALEFAELEIEELTKGTFFEKKPVLRFSAANLSGLDEIRRAIIKEADNVESKKPDQPFRLHVDQVWSISGFGTVVSGTACSGSISAGEPLYIMPQKKEIEARFVEVHRNKVQRAFAGQRIGLNLKNVSFKEVRRGMVLAQKGACVSGSMLNAELKLLETSPQPLKNRQKVKVYAGTSKVNASVVLMKSEEILPGEKALVQLRMEKKMAVLPKDAFVISLMNIQKVTGGGIILEITKEKFRKAKEKKVLPFLEAILSGDQKKIIDCYIKKDSQFLICSEQISEKTGFSCKEIEANLRLKANAGELLDFKNHQFMEKKKYQDIKKEVHETIKNYISENPLEGGVSVTEIKNRLLPFSEESVIQKIFKELAQEGKIIKKSKGFDIPIQTGTLPKGQQELTDMVIAFARDSDFMHFSAGKFCKYQKMNSKKKEVQKILNYLHEHKHLVRLNNGRYITNMAMDRIKERVKNFIMTNGSLSILDCKEVLGYGRSRGVPVFEYLDHIGFTTRMENKRILKQ
ncbi:MAG: selenocysteine-specific translation elongation factor [Desulfobacteraceae bacterium 4484_190.1]|nr:MAG: selenocysteine-specific translation elongation factor [Desulfobacteraceae bacterium 4484_190.1]